MRLRTRLFLLFLFSGILPLVFLLLAGWWPVRQQLSVWDLPTLDSALESSLRTNRRAQERVLRVLEDRGQTQAERITRAGGAVGARPYLSEEAVETPVDVALHFVPGPEGWRLHAAAGAPIDPVLVAERIPDPSSSNLGPQRSRPIEGRIDEDDVLLVPTFLWTPPPGSSEPEVSGCLLVGTRLGPGYFAGLDEVSEALVNYRRFGELGRILQRAQLLVLTAALLASLATSAILARRVARGISGPVEDLVAAMAAVGRGDVPPDSASSRIPELHEMGAAFGRMRVRLSEFEEQLRDAEQVRASQETARFVAHEIRNALTPVQAGLAVLERRVRGLPEESRPQGLRALGAIRREAERMASLASSFSEYAHLPDPSPEWIDPGVTLEAIAREVGPDLELKTEIESSRPKIHVDRDELERLLRNVVKNASEAMEGRGRLVLRLRQEPRWLAFEVEDDGPGMDERTRSRILQPGFTTKPDGSGLGLALVRRSVIRYGGKLEIESEPGRGTRVTIRLPLEPRGDHIQGKESPRNGKRDDAG